MAKTKVSIDELNLWIQALRSIWKQPADAHAFYNDWEFWIFTTLYW